MLITNFGLIRGEIAVPIGGTLPNEPSYQINGKEVQAVWQRMNSMDKDAIPIYRPVIQIGINTDGIPNIFDVNGYF